jgi:hypothetical protein
LKKIKINPCKDCQSTDVKIYNCGYSTFNVGSATCQKCKKKIEARYGEWNDNNWIIAEWNNENPTTKEEISQIKEEIKVLGKRLKVLEKRVKVIRK